VADGPSRLRILSRTLLLTLLVGLVFVGVILSRLVSGDLPHELAALALLVLLGADLWLALSFRRVDARPAARVVLALAALLAAGAVGALLASSSLPPIFDGLPLLPLLVLLVATADAARITRRLERAAVGV
jgi:hypothetical protein